MVAIGGNALAVKGERPTRRSQEQRLEVAALAVSESAGAGELVVTHGNGPQVGHLALLEERGRDGLLPLGMDVLTAETEGWIGYLLEDAIAGCATGADRNGPHACRGRCRRPGLRRADQADRPDVLAQRTGEGAAGPRLADAPPRGRLAACGRLAGTVSPAMGLEAIELLVQNGVTVIVGGGCIPVAIVDGIRRGVDAVIDKDLTSALLAIGLGADHLVLLTDVDAVYERWGTSRQKPIRRASTGELADLRRNDGAMGPKVEAACRFATGRTAVIASLSDAAAALRGTAGTTVVPE